MKNKAISKFFIPLIILIGLIILISSPVNAQSQLETKINVISIPNIFEIKPDLGINISIFVLWRDAQVFEATGLENSFAFSSSIWAYYYQFISKWFTIKADFELIVNQQYSYKARYKKFFDLDPIKIGYASLGFYFPYFSVIVGNIYSPDNDLSGEQIITPLAKTVPDFSTLPEGKIYYNIISSKPRDIPILYDSAPFNLYDTGIMLTLSLKPFFLSFYILNGEEGLDSNSDKYYVIKVAFSDEKIFLVDLLIGVGTMGSVPYKSYSSKIKLNFELNVSDFNIKAVASIFQMGLTHENPNVFSHSMIEEFGIDGLPFEPYDIPNLYNYGEPLYGYGFFVQARYENNLITFRINFSFMDPDFRYEHDDTIENGNYAIYQIKWRIFGDFGLQFLNKTLKIKIGASYTYNPVFLLGDQLYHYWEDVHAGDIDKFRLNYYLLFIIVEYYINLST